MNEPAFAANPLNYDALCKASRSAEANWELARRYLQRAGTAVADISDPQYKQQAATEWRKL